MNNQSNLLFTASISLLVIIVTGMVSGISPQITRAHLQYDYLIADAYKYNPNSVSYKYNPNSVNYKYNPNSVNYKYNPNSVNYNYNPNNVNYKYNPNSVSYKYNPNS